MRGPDACPEDRSLDGVLIVDKPAGMSSGFACRLAQRHFGFRKAGHLGTLDPLATGVLPLCINEGTRLAQFLMHADKEYVATMSLGIVTDTQDSQGRVLSATDRLPGTAGEVRAVCERFRGELLQVPPMYSALKRQGRPLYELARRGETVERQPRPVTVFALEVLGLALPEVTLRVHCSSGTYVRTLCHDIGQALGCGAHMSALRRTRCGFFSIGDATALDEALARGERAVPHRSFVAMREVLTGMPEALVAPELERAVCNGVALRGAEVSALCADPLPDAGLVKLIARDGHLLAVGKFIRDEHGGPLIRPVRVFAR